MGKKRQTVLAFVIFAALLSFAFGYVWLMSAQEQAWVVAHMYRDLPSCPPGAQRSSNLEFLAFMEQKRIPYQYPFTIGFGLGVLALGIAAWPSRGAATTLPDHPTVPA